MTDERLQIRAIRRSDYTARRRHRLSRAQVQMARELGMNFRTLGKLDIADQEHWKLPLPEFIESLYRKPFWQGSTRDRAVDRGARSSARRETGCAARGKAA
jgi:hypothetical protein